MKRIKIIFAKIKAFFRKLFIKEEEGFKGKSLELADFPPSLYFGNNHWELFLSYFKKAENEIKILTGSISDTALSLLVEGLNDHISIRIITGRGRGYEQIFSMKNIGIENIRRCSRLHGKLCIIDGNALLAGSSNITIGSLGNTERSGFFEADFATEDKNIIESATYLFDALWNENSDIEFLKNDSGFISSAFGVPLKIKTLIEEAQEEIVIVVPTFFTPPTDYKSIATYIRELNSIVKIKIVTSYRIGKDQIPGYDEIRSIDNVEIIPVKSRIHAKVYCFDNRIALISSINLTFTSWITSLETGILVRKGEILENIRKTIKDLEKKKVPIQIIEPKATEPKGSQDEDIELLFPKFTPEGEVLRSELKIKSPAIPLKVDEGESVKIEGLKESSKKSTRSKPLDIEVVEPAFKKKSFKKKSSKKKTYSRKFPNLNYWTFDQLIQYAMENDIPPAVSKNFLIRNIENSDLKTAPRLYFVQNLLDDITIFGEYVGLALIDDLFDLSRELSKRYKRYYQCEDYTWYSMRPFIINNSDKKAVIYLLEKYLAPREEILRDLLKKRCSKEEFFSIFPDKISEEEIKEEKKKIYRNIKPYIRSLVYYPNLFRRIVKEFGLKGSLVRILKDVEKDHAFNLSLGNIVSEVMDHLDNEAFVANLENLLESKRNYIFKMIEMKYNKKFIIVENECEKCGVKIDTGKTYCNVCNRLVR